MGNTWWQHGSNAVGGGFATGQVQPSRPPPPPPKVAAPAPALNSWARWQQIHPGSPYQDYQGWWQQHGQYGATIMPDAPKGGGGGINLGSVLGTIGKIATTAAPVIAAVAGDALTGAAHVAVNPVWAAASTVLTEAATALRAAYGDAESRYHAVSMLDRLAILAYDLSLAPNAELEAEFHELGLHLERHPMSDQLASYIATHPALAAAFRTQSAG